MGPYFAVASGETIAVGGATGAGKTTIAALLTRLYDWVNTPPGAMVKPKDPREYLRKLSFHRTVKSIAAYGLT